MARARRQQKPKPKPKKEKGAKQRKRLSLAQQADRYDLYQRSVQEPEPDLLLIQRVFKKRFGRMPRLIREDFCGTALLACQWVERHRENRAFGIDLDPEPLDWGRQHNVARLGTDQASRIKLIQGDVRDVATPAVDVTIAFNFSYFLFEKREELRDYFRRARATLQPEGLFVCDAYGGPEAHHASSEERDCDGFTYVWDQSVFEPISHHCVNYIHFEFEDGSRLQRAFRYEWRLWSLPELRELLLEAGFSEVEIYWEGTDTRTNEGNGVFTRREKVSDDPAWVCYLVAAG